MKRMRIASLVVLLCGLATLVAAVDARAAADDRVGLDESLITAVRHGESGKVGDLLEQGANPNAANDLGWTPLHYAARACHLEIMEKLISKGADVNRKDIHGRTPLLEAAASLLFRRRGAKRAAALGLLLEAGAKPEATALEAAAATGSEEAIQVLLDAGVHPDAGIVGAARAGGLGLVKSFLDRGASVNAKGDHGFTALHVAVSGRYTEVARFLIERGADLDARSNHGKTPLHIAARRDGGFSMARLLIEAGAAVNIPNNEGVTPIRRAAIEGEIEIYHVLLKANGGVETVAPGFVDDGSRPTAELIADLTSKNGAVRKAAETALVARGEKIMPEVLQAIRSGTPIEQLIELFIKMGPAAEAALPELESGLDDPRLAFWLVIKMNQMKPGHFASLPHEMRDRAAVAVYEFVVDPESEGMSAGMVLEMFPGIIGKASAPYVLKLLRSDNPQHRADAAESLSGAPFATDELRSQLVKLLLEDPDHEVRKEVAGALGNPQYHGPEAMAALFNVLRMEPLPAETLPGEPSSPEREAAYYKRTAVGGLLDAAARSLASYGPIIIEELLPWIQTGSDPTWERFRKAWSYLGADAVPHFERLLDHEDERIRGIAFEELGRLANESSEAVEILLGRIGSDDRETKRLTTAALLKINKRAGQAVLPTLHAMTGDADIPIRTRLAAVRTALKVDEELTKESADVKQFLPRMIAAAENGEYYTRIIALEALGELGRAAAPALERIKALADLKLPEVPPAKEPLIVQDGKIISEDPARREAVLERARIDNIRRAAEDAQERIERDFHEARR